MNATARDLRILIMAPTARDGGITTDLLNGAGIETATFTSLDTLVAALNDGAAAVLVAEEHLAASHKGPLAAWLLRQPPWSDLPILILTRPGADSPESAEAWRTLGNVTLLERPTRVTTLLSAAQTAIRARSRQYRIRGHLVERPDDLRHELEHRHRHMLPAAGCAQPSLDERGQLIQRHV